MDPMKALRGVAGRTPIWCLPSFRATLDDSYNCLFVRSLGETEHRSILRIKPVGVIFDTMFALYLNVQEVGSSQFLG